MTERLGRIVAACLPFGGVGTAEIDGRRRHRKIYEFGIPRVLEAVNVALRKAHDISFREWRGCSTSQQQDAAPAQRDPDLFRSRVGMWRILGPRRDRDSRNGYTLRPRILGEKQLLGRYTTVSKRRDLASANDLHGGLRNAA